jgi:hypothetical protein
LALILALESDHRQATLLGNLIREQVHAELQIVDSRDAALAAIASRIPDVILLSSLLSPRDEEDLLKHLRLLEGAEHVQTHNIPMMATGTAEEPSGGGLFGRLRRKPKKQEIFAVCDPAVFAAEITSYVIRAEEAKIEAAARAHALVPLTAQPPAVDTPSSSTHDAFTWKPREEPAPAPADTSHQDRAAAAEA